MKVIKNLPLQVKHVHHPHCTYNNNTLEFIIILITNKVELTQYINGLH